MIHWYSKVAWNQGMMVQPQHFQQSARYFEHLITARCAGLTPYDWGVHGLKIDQALLRQGKFAVTSCAGRFPDGTPFEVSLGDALPSVLDVPEVQDRIVYLTLPLHRVGMTEISAEQTSEGLVRFTGQEVSVSDTVFGHNNSQANIEIAAPNLRLALGDATLADYTSIAIAHIVERQADGRIVLSDTFIPACLSCQSVVRIVRIMEELQSLLEHRANALSKRISDGTQGGANTSEIADFLFLQTINRYQPVLTHLVSAQDIHPEFFYRLLLQIAGELATFTRQDRRPCAYPAYSHHDLNQTYAPILDDLRTALATVLEHSATQLPVEARKFGIYVSPIVDRTLIKHTYFVLAVKASNTTDELRRHFPAQVKIGPVESIRNLVNMQLPGIALNAMSVAPRQIPYHAGFTYFELERSGELWEQLNTSGGFAFHIGGEFDNLTLELWSIKE